MNCENPCAEAEVVTLHAIGSSKVNSLFIHTYFLHFPNLSSNVLIDCGSSNSFIDYRYVFDNHFPVVSIP